MKDAVIVEAVRTPIGKGRANGGFHNIHPADLFAYTLKELSMRSGIDPKEIDDVIGGVVTAVGDQALNHTRQAVLSAGFPESVPATTVDRQCGSSQQAIHFAAQGIISGAYDLVIAGGVESMSRVPMGSNLIGSNDVFGSGVNQRYPDGLVGQGISAELIASRWGISRMQMDEFSLWSHSKARIATDEGKFQFELAPLNGISEDEGIRNSNLETLAGLKPAYYSDIYAERFPQIEWNITAGNTSQISDGSAAVLITTSEKAKKLGLKPLARLHSFAVAGDDPLYMLTAIIPATEKVLKRAGLTLNDIDIFEVNEAFASVVLAWVKETGADLNKVNINGGAIAIGHPLGASGARLMTTLVHILNNSDAKYALQTMCEGGGLSNATILERL